MIICKFGGTSVADREAITRLMGIIRAARQAAIQPESQDWRGPVVVVSALGGATDRLLGVAAEAAAGDIDGASQHIRAPSACFAKYRRGGSTRSRHSARSFRAASSRPR